MNNPAFPATLYSAWGHYGRDGWTCLGDPSLDLTGAMDQVLDVMGGSDAPTFWRVFRDDMNPDTDMPERREDVTEEVRAAAIKWHWQNAWDIPTWLSGERDEYDDEGAAADDAWHDRMEAAE